MWDLESGRQVQILKGRENCVCKKPDLLLWEDGDEEAGGLFMVYVEFVELVQGLQAGRWTNCIFSS